MNLAEIDIDGTTYRVEKMSALTQFHVARKIGPVVPSATMLYLSALQVDKPLPVALPALLPVAQPLIDELAKLPDDALDYVIGECMSLVRRRDGVMWFPIWNQAAREPMFDDVDIRLIMRLTVHILAATLGPFIDGWLTSPSGRPNMTESNGQASPEEKTGS